MLAAVKRLCLALLLPLAIGACDSGRVPAEPSSPGSPAAPARAAQARAPEADLSFIERVTAGADREARLPMIVAIHGLGDRPEAFIGVFDGFATPARIVSLRAPDPWGDGFAWFPFRPNDSVETRAQGIDRAAARVVTTMRSLVARRPTRGKPIVTGFSQGGMLSFAIAAEHPELVRAAIPVSGVLPEPLFGSIRPGAAGPRIVALHGEADERVPLDPTRRGVAALVGKGFDARLETFPGVGHQIPPPVRRRWLELLTEEARSP
jgi:phospholipase/carboxylesterase